MIHLELNESNFALVDLKIKEAPQKVMFVTSRALNRTIAMTKTRQTKDAKSKYTLLNSLYAGGISVLKANPGNLMASVNAKGAPISLEYFKVSSKKRNNRKRLTVEVKKGESKSLGDAFIGYSNRATVCQRLGAERVPLKQLFGPSLPQILGETSILEQLTIFSNDKFNERFEHEFMFEFNK